MITRHGRLAGAVLVASLASWAASAEDHPAASAGECGCFLTDGSSEAYYKDHLFFDFRSLSRYAKVPDLTGHANDTASAAVTSNYFSSAEWTNQWSIQAWNNSDTRGTEGSDAKVLLVNSANNVYIEANENSDDSSSESASDTYLTLRTARLPGFQSAAEVESASAAYHFLSIRMYARTIGSAGACTAMFTYRDGVSKLADVQEADVEFLTAGPRDRVQYTNQPSFTADGDDVPGATVNATLPRGLTFGDWAVHRLDWTPKATTWFVDGEEVRSTALQVPRDPSRVLFNAWSDGGSWSGAMDEGGEAYLQVQWIELLYNSTSPGADGVKGRSLGRRDGTSCGVVCSIDEASTVGGIVKLTGSAAPRHGASRLGLLVLLAATMAGLA